MKDRPHATLFKFWNYPVWAILFIGLSTTTFLTWYLNSVGNYEDDLRFEYEADQAAKRIQYRMERYEAALIQTRAFFLSSQSVTKSEFHNYFEKTRLLDRYPGIQGLGLALKVKPHQIQQHVAKMRKEIKGYDVWPKVKDQVNFPIVFLEPISPMNNKALGYNMYSEPVRYEAMKKSWESGLPAASGKVTLVQEKSVNQQPGFNLYVPYYRDNVPLDTQKEREENLIGFIFSPFRTYDLFNSIFFDFQQDIDIEIFDGEIRPVNLIFDFDHVPRFGNQEHLRLKKSKSIIIAGHTFTMFVFPSPHFKQQFSVLTPIIVAITGILITILLCRILWINHRQAELSKESEKALQEAVKARDEFLSIASHELKTPLTSLKLQAQVIKRSLDKDDPKAFSKERMKSLVNQTERQTIRLERLVDDMLDISRIRTGKLTIEKEQFNLSDLVNDVLQRMQEQFNSIQNGSPKLNDCPDSHGLWDKMRIEQVIINLLTNAIKYGDHRPIEVEITADPDSVTLKVKDHGKGIAPEYQEKIFNRFERAGVSPSEISGLGLGLFITKQIILSHSGKIWVESQLGKGSTFIVQLPRNINV